MAAIHVVVDPREKPLELRWDAALGDKYRMHHATISLDGLVFDGPEEIEKIAGDLIKMVLASVQETP